MSLSAISSDLACPSRSFNILL